MIASTANKKAPKQIPYITGNVFNAGKMCTKF